MERINNDRIMFLEGDCYNSLNKQCSNFDYIIDNWMDDFYNGTREISNLNFDIKDVIRNNIENNQYVVKVNDKN